MIDSTINIEHDESSLKRVPPVSAAELEQEEEDEDQNYKIKRNGIDLNKLSKKAKVNESLNPLSVSNLTIQKQNSQSSNNQKSSIAPKPSISSNLESVSTELKQKYEKILNIYKSNNELNSLSEEVERKRWEIKEKIFQQLAIGYIEQINAGNQHMANMSCQEIYNQCKPISVSVENILYQKLNRGLRSQLLPAYIDRCKVIYVNLKDPNNSEFRRKIIQGEFKPEDLWLKEEKEFYNPIRQKELQEQHQRLIQNTQMEMMKPKETVEEHQVEEQQMILENRLEGELKDQLELLINPSIVKNKLRSRITQELSEVDQKISQLLSNLIDDLYKH